MEENVQIFVIKGLYFKKSNAPLFLVENRFKIPPKVRKVNPSKNLFKNWSRFDTEIHGFFDDAFISDFFDF